MNINANIDQETVLTMTQAVEHTKRSRNTLQKWIKQGCRGIVLEVSPYGGLWRTSKEAIDRFQSALLEQARNSK